MWKISHQELNYYVKPINQLTTKIGTSCRRKFKNTYMRRGESSFLEKGISMRLKHGHDDDDDGC